MALKTVTGKITRPDGIVGAVSLRIVLSAPAAIAGTQEVVPAAIDVTVAPDGTWSQQLQANLDLLPATTSYTALETIGGVTAPFIFVVPQSAGPFKLADILAAAPAPSPPAALDSAVVHIANPETITGAKTFSAAPIFGAGAVFAADQIVAMGTGDLFGGYSVISPQILDIRAGTAAVPDIATQPLVRLSRVQAVPDTNFTGDGVDTLSTLFAGSSTPASGQGQGVGIFGYAETFSTYVGAHGAADAAAGYFLARSKDPSTRTAIGLFSNARIDSLAGGNATAIELSVENRSGTDHSVNVAGFSKSSGIWIHATGPNRSAVGMQFGNPFGVQFDVGIHFNSQNAGVGPTLTADIQSDSAAASGVLIKGTHAVAALAVNAGAGKVLIGGLASVFGFANGLVEVQGSNNHSDGLVAVGSVAFQKDYSIRLRNSASQALWGIVGGAGDFAAGTAVGDAVFGISTAGKTTHLVGNATKVISIQDAGLGFFGAAPAPQPAGSDDLLGSLVTLGLRAGSANPPLDLGTGALLSGTLALAAGGSAATGIAINGTHATAALAIAAGSGPALIGGTSSIFAVANNLLEIQATTAADVDGVVSIGATSGSHGYQIRVRNGVGQAFFGVDNAGGHFVGTAAGDAVIGASTTGKMLHIGGTTKIVTVTRANTLGFFAAAPVAQQATTGTAAGFTANAGTAVQDASTFTGGSGASAYRISDIVLALKNYGLLAA